MYMIKGGVDGSSTQVGNKFEDDVLNKICQSIINKGYQIDNIGNILNLCQEKKGNIIREQKFYKFFNINWEEKISKELRPDIGILINGTFFIIECKYQGVSGSVDEKLQTCDFKKKQYEKLMFGSNIKIEYVYVLNEYFKDPKYKDVLEYIKSVKCYYYFDEYSNCQARLNINR